MRKNVLMLLLPLAVSVFAQREAGPAKPSEVKAEAVIIGDPVEFSLSLKREGKLRKARMVLEEALEADPRNWRAHHLLGWICLEMKEKQAVVHHLRRAVYLGPPSSKEVNLDARTVNRLLSERGEHIPLGPMFSARAETLRIIGLAILLSVMGEQMGLGERERGMLFGLGILLGRMAKRLEPFAGELNQSRLSLVSAVQGGDWVAVASELEEVGGIFQRAARGATQTEEGCSLNAIGSEKSGSIHCPPRLGWGK